MEKFVPLEKLSKRKKRELMAKKRHSWGGLSPVTRKPANPRAYERKKSRKIGDDTDFPGLFPYQPRAVLRKAGSTNFVF